MKPRLSVIIPCYNEGKIIAGTVQAVTDFFNEKSWPIEVIVVDDGSTDDTAAQAQAAGARAIRHQTNQGKGAAVAAGMAVARGWWALFLDADLATPINQFDELWYRNNDADIIIGSRAVSAARIIQAQSWRRRTAGLVGNRFVRLILNLPYADTQCGFKLFSSDAREIFKQQRLRGFGFDFELLLIAKRHGLQVREVGVRWAHGMQSAVHWQHYPLTIIEALRVKYHDLIGDYDPP
ncbi:MAG: glycosyltransferase [Patescibacteria group bacterium]